MKKDSKGTSNQNDPAGLGRIAAKLSPDEKTLLAAVLGEDPLKRIYAMGLAVWVTLMAVFLLWPFDFISSSQKNNVRRLDSPNGIYFPENGQVLSRLPAEGLFGRLLGGAGFSVELWLKAENEDQSGPARIVSYSLNPFLRNFTIGQSEDALVVRLRTTKTDLNGINPQLEVGGVFDREKPQHIVVTYDFNRQCVFVDGARRTCENIPGGRFSNWDPSHHLVLGNEMTGDRPWLGEIYFVGIYRRVLTEKEIQDNHRAGRRSGATPSPNERSDVAGIVARYPFLEKTGSEIVDTAGLHPPLDLYIPQLIQVQRAPYLGLPKGLVENGLKGFGDVVLNLLVFFPVGFFFHGLLQSHGRLSGPARVLVVLISGTLISLGAESLQYLSPTRHSSLVDLAMNATGTAAGIWISRAYHGLLQKKAKRFLGKVFSGHSLTETDRDNQAR